MSSLSRHPEDMHYARKSLPVAPFLLVLVVAVGVLLVVLNALD